VLVADLVEGVPDTRVIVAIGAAGKGDAWAGRSEDLGVGAPRAARNSRLSMSEAVSAR
jgi:hypothetical protein